MALGSAALARMEARTLSSSIQYGTACGTGDADRGRGDEGTWSDKRYPSLLITHTPLSHSSSAHQRAAPPPHTPHPIPPPPLPDQHPPPPAPTCTISGKSTAQPWMNLEDLWTSVMSPLSIRSRTHSGGTCSRHSAGEVGAGQGAVGVHAGGAGPLVCA